MGIIEGGISGNIAEVDQAFEALHVTERPHSVKAGGSYRACMVSGLVTGATLDATPDPIFSWRWSSSSYLGIVRLIRVEVFMPTSFTAAAERGTSIVIARSFTASDSGGTAATLTGNAFKKRTSHATTKLGDMRIASTAELTAGTRTLDAQPIGEVRSWELAAAAAVPHYLAVLEFDERNPGSYPIVMAQNEGFVVHNTVTATASGTLRYTVTVDWDEIIIADYPG